MNAIRSTVKSKRREPALVLCVLAGLAAPSVALAQSQPQQQKAETSPAAAEPKLDLFGSIARWLDESVAKIGSSFKDAKSNVDNFNREAGIAAKSTADAAKDAADAMARLPAARVIIGHQNCTVAANGAPDCIAASLALCKAQGFKSGKSVDMTTAEECPPQVMLGRRAAAPGECKTITFVSRALCQ